MKRISPVWLTIALGWSLMGWGAKGVDDHTYVLPLNTQNISEIRIIHPVGTLDVSGTEKPSAHMVFQRVDHRSFTDNAFLPSIETLAASVLEIRPPKGKAQYVSPLRMTLYLPRMNVLRIEGDVVQLQVKDVPHLKTLAVNAKRLDLNLDQSKLKFTSKSGSGNISINKCDYCKAQMETQTGKIYLKQSSGTYEVAGDHVLIESNQVSGTQTYVVDDGEIKLLGAQGATSIKGVSASVTIQGELPDDLSVTTRSGDIFLPVETGDAISWDIQAPVGQIMGLPAGLEVHRLTKERHEKIKRALLQSQKQITLQTLTGTIHFLQ